MKIHLLIKDLHCRIFPFLLIGIFTINALVDFAQTTADGFSLFYKKDGPTVSLLFKDTLTIPSFTEFSLQVKMKTGYEISAISLGFYFPEEYLEITGMELAHGTQGYYYSVTDSLFIMAWSDVSPINIADEDTILTLGMKSLDLAGLTGTIKLRIYELSEFADKSANVIDSVVLEIPEIEYLVPDTVDSLAGNYVQVYPNPFNDYTSIIFYLKNESKVKISLFNLAGMEMKQAVDAIYPEGTHQVKLYGTYLAKGVYLLKFVIMSDDQSNSKLFKIISIR